MTGYPFIDLFYNATQSRAAASGMTAVIICCEIAAGIAALAAASRQVWAFARNRGVPFSHLFAPVSIVPPLACADVVGPSVIRHSRQFGAFVSGSTDYYRSYQHR
jgi:Amino acid permease